MLNTQRKRIGRHKVLNALTAYWAEHGYGPSHRELQALCGFDSVSTVTRWLVVLEEDGLVDRGQFGLARAVKPVVKEGSRCPLCHRV
jgi:SOS-response transcriptional repressor LexA